MPKIKISSEKTVTSGDISESFISSAPDSSGQSSNHILKVAMNNSNKFYGVISIGIFGLPTSYTDITSYKGSIEDIFNNFQVFIETFQKCVNENPSQTSASVSQVPSSLQSVKTEKTCSPIYENDNEDENQIKFKSPPMSSQVNKLRSNSNVGSPRPSNSSSRPSNSSSRPSNSSSRPSNSSSRPSTLSSEGRDSMSSIISSASEATKSHIPVKDVILAKNTPEYEMPTKSELDVTYIAETDNEEMETEKGVFKVYALYPRDRYFYSGTKKEMDDSSIEVVLDAFDKVDIDECDVYNVACLPIETEVEVQLEAEGPFLKGFKVVKNIKKKYYGIENMDAYEVMGQDSHYEVFRNQVRVREDIMRVIISRQGDEENIQESSISNISIGNIVEGKRVRKPKRHSLYLVEKPVKRCGSPSIHSVQTNKRVKKNISALAIRKDITDTNLFYGKYFMITSSLDADDGEEQRKSIKNKITLNGGAVIDYPKSTLIYDHMNLFSEIVLVVLGTVEEIWKRKTVKYLYALAIGNVPIVDVRWVEDSIKNHSPMNYDFYMHYRGVHPITKEYVHPNIDLKKKPVKLFSKLKIWIVDYEKTEFSTYWENIIDLGGGQYQILNLSEFSMNLDKTTCDFVLAEPDGITKRLLNRLNEMEIPLVNADFIMDSLIANEILDYNQYKITSS